MATFTASVDKGTVGNNEAYRITTTSSVTPHSIDVWINQNYVDRQVASYPSKAFYISETGLISFASFYYTSESSITLSVNGSAKTLRIHNSSGSYVIDVVVGSTNGLTNPLYMTVYNNYAYVLNENAGTFEVFRYYLLASTVTRDTSTGGLNACSYIAGQCLANSKFLFGIDGECYLVNGSNVLGDYSILIRINIQTGTTQQLFITSTVPNKTAFAIDSRGGLYIADTNGIEKILLTNDGIFQNIAIVDAFNINTLQNITNIYIDPFDILYVIQNDGSGSGTTIRRFFNTGPYYEPVQRGGIDQSSVTGATLIQFSPDNQKLYIMNSTNSTIYSYLPNFQSTFEYTISPAKIVLRANLANGIQKEDRLSVLHQFTTNILSEYLNPRYQSPGNSSGGYATTRGTRSEYLIEYNSFKEGNLIDNAFNYQYQEYASSISSFTCGDMKIYNSSEGYIYFCLGSSSTQKVQLFLFQASSTATYSLNAITSIVPQDIIMDDLENIYILRFNSGDNKYYLSRYDLNLYLIQEFEVEYNSGLSITPRSIAVDEDQNTYVIYDAKVKKYNSSGTFLVEASFGSGSVADRRAIVDWNQNFLYVSDNSFLGFYKYPLSLASVTQITLSSPPGVITQFDVDIYQNFHIHDSSGYMLYTYNSTGTLIQSMSSLNITPIRMHIYNHMRIGYLADGSMYYQSRRGYDNVSYNGSYFDVTDTETGALTISSTMRYLDGSTKAGSFPYRRHSYTVNTSSTNISSSTNRIALNSTTDNNGNAILPERIMWWKDGIVKKESIRSYKKVVGISDIEDPISISINNSGHLYVLNDNTYTIDVYNTNNFNSNNYPLIQSISLYNDEGTVRDLFVDQNGYIYVLLDSNDDDLFVCRKYDQTGQNILLTVGPFDSPYNIFVDTTNHIYVTDRGNDEVYKYNSSGTEVLRIPFSNPRSVAVDSLFNIYIADDEEIYKFDFEGNPVGPSPYLSGFDYIRDMFIRASSSNDLFICDSDTNRLYKYDSTGTQVWFIQNLDSPRCAVTDASGNIFISNYNADSIVKYNSTGTTLLETFKNNPEDYSFTIDGSGNVYMVDSSRIIKYDSSYNIVKTTRLNAVSNYSLDTIVCDRTNQFLYMTGYDYNINQPSIFKMNLQLEYITSYPISFVGSYLGFIKTSYSSTTNRLYLLCNDSGSSNQVIIYDFASSSVVNTISLPVYDYIDIVVNPLDNDTFYLVNNIYQFVVRYRLVGMSYVDTTIFSYPKYAQPRSIAIDSTHLYLGTVYVEPYNNLTENNVGIGENKIYKLTLASDSYTETYVYNAIRPQSIEIYNGNVYVNEIGDFIRIIQNNTQNIIYSFQAQDYDGEIAADSSGNIYVKNTVTGNLIIKYDSTGSLAHKFEDSPGADCLCVDGSSHVYIASSNNLETYTRSTIGTMIRIDKYTTSGTPVGSITNTVTTNNQYTFINYPLQNEVRGMTCDGTYLYVAFLEGPIIRFNKTTLQLDYAFQITNVTSPEYILFKNSSLYVLQADYQIRKYQLTSTSGNLQLTLNVGRNFQQFGIDTNGKAYIPYNDRIYVYENDFLNIYSSIVSLDTDYLYLGPSNKIYVADQDGSVSVYDTSIPNTYSSFLDVTEDGEYEIHVEYYDYQYSANYTVSGLVPGPPEPETYIEYLERIDLEMIPYYLYDAVLEKNETEIIQLFKSNRSVVLKICNFYQKMKNAHENPRRLNTPFNYNPQWYTKIRFDESQPSVPYFVGYRDMYFFYLFYYNKTVSLNMFYLIDVAQRYYRTLLLAQRAVNTNQDTSVYYRLDSSIQNNFQLIQYVNSFLICF